MSYLTINHVVNSSMPCHIYLVKMIVEKKYVKIILQIMSRGLGDISFSLYSNHLFILFTFCCYILYNGITFFFFFIDIKKLLYYSN